MTKEKDLENRTYIYSEFLRYLRKVYDLDYQERVWIHGDGPEVEDFDEFENIVTSYMDMIQSDPKKYNVSASQENLIKTFCNRLDEFSDEHYFPKEFIKENEWRQLGVLAKNIVTDLQENQLF